ncbi:hypothetical protein BC828DRAFT_376195 [Blastocladiella britannica]|nr:hypothetical protein BC828DRAFT_376195 [Blastocladiella britannica]
MSVVRQRRRWFFGAISNEVYMLTDSNVWTKFTFMNTFKTIQIAFRTNFFSQVVMSVFAVASVHNEPNSLIPLIISAGVPLVLNYIAAIATAIKLGHSKVFFMQPIMLITMTVVQVFIDFYALFTIRQRSWGGPRHMVAEPAEVTATVEVDVNASPAAPSEASSSASSTKSGPITFKASPSTAQASSRAVASDEQV